MTSQLQSRARQSGAYLLEALIGILIFALGVLGIVGLQAASLRTTTDSSLRAEAVFAATQLVGQMWADKYVCVVGGGTPPCAPQYTSSTLGPAYVAWAAELKAAQGGAWFQDPVVDFAAIATAKCNPNPDPFSATAYIEIFWQSPDGVNNPDCNGVPCHIYSTCAVIGQNINT